jgi:acyl-CoA synthetase (NDP forming)
MQTALQRMLNPRGIAVVGASSNPTKRGHQAIRQMLADEVEARIYPIHPRETEILGLRAYPSVSALGEKIDIAYVSVPASQLRSVLQDCGRAGVAGAVVIANGFGETGDEGRQLQNDLLEWAAEAKVRIVGPNTSGVFNLAKRMNLVGAPNVPAGSIAIASQSGNVAISLWNEARQVGSTGFSAYVGVGNEADLGFADVLDYARDDDDTSAVVMYVEGFRDPRRVLQSIRRIVRTKPVVLLKAGRSEFGRRAALSHTGAIADEARVAYAALRQAGAVIVERSDELFSVVDALRGQPFMRGNRVAVLTDGGGQGTIAADALNDMGLQLAVLSTETQQALAAFLPAAAATGNPVDVAGATDDDPSLFLRCAQQLAADQGVDAILLLGLYGGYGQRFGTELARAEDRIAAQLADIPTQTQKPLVTYSAYSDGGSVAHSVLRSAGVPVLDSIEVAARCVQALAERGGYLATLNDRSSIGDEKGRREDPGPATTALLESDARRLLEQFGIDFGEWFVANSAEEAHAAVANLNVPVAMKVLAEGVVHKSAAGGVRLGVIEADAHSAFVDLARIAASPGTGASVLIAPMVDVQAELIIGAVRDPGYGPVLLFGRGGTSVERDSDVQVGCIPMATFELDHLIDSQSTAIAELKSPPIRENFRRLMNAVMTVMQSRPDVTEIDLNPVCITTEGVRLVDARVVTSRTDSAPAKTLIRTPIAEVSS